VILIGKTDWNAIRTEYICGDSSQRKLAEKYGVSEAYLMKKAHQEHWKKSRDEAVKKGIEKSQRNAAAAISDNATIAARIRTKLLRKLEKEIDALPDRIGSEHATGIVEYGKNDKGTRQRKEITTAYKLKDLTAAYKDLTGDMVQSDATGNELLQSLLDLERGTPDD
jgi:3-methyladenine DNA glycosylase AlkD